jgi:hypothetical protein
MRKLKDSAIERYTMMKETQPSELYRGQSYVINKLKSISRPRYEIYRSITRGSLKSCVVKVNRCIDYNEALSKRLNTFRVFDAGSDLTRPLCPIGSFELLANCCNVYESA